MTAPSYGSGQTIELVAILKRTRRVKAYTRGCNKGPEASVATGADLALKARTRVQRDRACNQKKDWRKRIQHSRRREPDMEEKGSVERIVYFSDAVFAIAITLLVLEIRVPAGLSSEGLGTALVEMWPKYSSYLISFTVIGSSWRTHHLIFRHIKAYDELLISLNFLYLMCVAFLPFSASLIGEYGSQAVAFQIYAINVAGAGVFLGGTWWYATRGGRLTDGGLDPGLIRQIMTEQLSLPMTSLIFLPISFFFGVTSAVYSVIILLLIAFVVRRTLPCLRAHFLVQVPRRGERN